MTATTTASTPATEGSSNRSIPTFHRLEAMTGGWFVGAFEPAALHCESAEVGVKHYTQGDTEPRHEHRVATEVTLILTGEALMCGRTVRAGDIVVMPPGTSTGFEALSAVTTVVLKTPSVLGDKYLVDDPQEPVR